MGTRKVHQLIAFGMLAAGALFTSTPRAEAVEVQQRAVRYADLNLERSEDATRLYARIKHAAATVCDRFDSRSLAQQTRRRQCVRQAIEGAVAHVNAPLLTDLHSHRRELQLADAN